MVKYGETYKIACSPSDADQSSIVFARHSQSFYRQTAKKRADQPTLMRRLLWVFAGRTCNFVRNTNAMIIKIVMKSNTYMCDKTISSSQLFHMQFINDVNVCCCCCFGLLLLAVVVFFFGVFGVFVCARGGVYFCCCVFCCFVFACFFFFFFFFYFLLFSWVSFSFFSVFTFTNVPVSLMNKAFSCILLDLQITWEIWASSSEKILSHVQNACIQITLRMRKVSYGLLLSVYTFCSIQWFCQRTVKALISLRGCAGISGLSLSAHARKYVFAWRSRYDIHSCKLLLIWNYSRMPVPVSNMKLYYENQQLLQDSVADACVCK